MGRERERENRDGGVIEMISADGLALFLSSLPLSMLFCEGCQFIEMSAHSTGQPDALGCRPSSFCKTHSPHGFKEWKYWSCGLWFSLSRGRNLVAIGKVFKL